MSEKDFYQSIKENLERLFRSKVEKNTLYFEITANGKFTNKLKEVIPSHLNIVFTFLKGKELLRLYDFVLKFGV